VNERLRRSRVEAAY
jgi:hypothetical protein